MSYGRYKELALLGRGGMARVVLAALPGAAGVQKLLVIKEILPEYAQDPEYIGMFTDEARLATRLEHPNLVQTYEFSEDGGRFFFVMEFLDGRSYGSLLSRARADVSLGVHLHILGRVLAGLHHAHELATLDGAPMGVVHRDVSPQNIFLTYGGAIKLVDFGVAKSAGAQVKTRTGMFKGKLAYAAPEQVDNQDVDRRADIFAVGVLLWEAVTQRRISKDLSEAGLLQRRLMGTDPKLGEAAPGTPEVLARICDRAMARDKTERFATALEMQRALDSYVESAGLRITDVDVGALVARTFEAERSELRKLIAQRMSSTGKMDSDEPPPLPPALTSQGSLPTSDAGSKPTNVSVIVEPPTVIDKPPRAAWMMRAIAGAGVVVVLGAVAFGVVMMKRKSDARIGVPVESASIGSASPSEAPSSAPLPHVEVRAKASPPQAHFSLDGVAIAGNPAKMDVPRDKGAHTLRAEADGYAPEERTLTGERDMDLELTLTKKNDPKKPVAPAGDPPNPKRPPKGIDTSDPWGGK